MRKRSKSKKDISLAASIIIAFLLIFKIYILPDFSQPINDSEFLQISDKSETINSSKKNLQIHYIDVGQADSILVTLNDKSMLIDAGNNSDGKLVVEYITNQGISTLDYVIGTHPHEDHIGGLDDVIKAFDIETVLMPKVQNNTKTFEDVLDALIEKNISVTSPNVGDTYPFSKAEFTILSCKNEDTNELNTSSIVIRLVFGEQSYIFCADAEKENEYDMMASGLELKSNVIKIAHHGSSTSSLEKFLLAVNPETAIISVGKENDYGHPHEKIIKRLNRLGIKVYRTDLNGTITITSDGKSNSVLISKEG